MKKLIPLGLLGLVFLSFCPAGRAADFKIATVDLRKVFESYYKTVQANIAISNNLAERDKELNSMIDARKKNQGDWQEAEASANTMSFSADERDKYKKKAADLLVELQIRSESISNYYATTEAKRREEMARHVNDLTAEIFGVMNAMAKKQGYTLVLDRTAVTMTGNPLVLYTSGENDLTDSLVKELNSTAPATPAPDTNSPAGVTPGAKPAPK